MRLTALIIGFIIILLITNKHFYGSGFRDGVIAGGEIAYQNEINAAYDMGFADCKKETPPTPSL